MKLKRIKTIKANKCNYDITYKRSYDDIRGIVIHNTSNVGDKAISNARFFSNKVTPSRSAHFFIDRDGEIYKSVYVHRVAWSVGQPSKGVLYNNKNTISIELCDIVDKDISEKQLDSLKWLIKRLKKKCKNCTQILRHYDINGKECPVRYVDSKKWEELRKELLK